MSSAPSVLLSPAALGALLDALRADGFRLVGPTVRDGAIVYDEIAGLADLPEGVGEEQEAGRYRLVRRGDRRLFGFSSPADSFKARFFPPIVPLYRLRRKDGSFVPLDDDAPAPPPIALVGARSCDLHAIGIQDRVFLAGPAPDPRYGARRQGAFVIALQCGQAGGTCFCVSMGTGPRAERGFDLALTELVDDRGHRFVVEIGSPAGAARVDALAAPPAPAEDVEAAARAVEGTAHAMGRSLDTRGIRDLLLGNLEHPRWDDVAARCLACTNCTLVCPTCFCSDIEDRTDLDGEIAERRQRWDSCFTLGHSHLHGGSVHGSIRSRYRQWLTHKLASWIDQYGTSGCVGCGRCITWCPVGIDITQEVRAIRGGG